MRFLTSILSIVFCALFSYGASAQIPEYTPQAITEHFTIKDGLPSNLIFDIYQDRNGLIWIATKQGICYFDGFTFHEVLRKDQRVIANKIMEDQQGNIWLINIDDFIVKKKIRQQVINSIQIYTPASNAFKTIEQLLQLRANELLSISQNSQNCIHLTTKEGILYRYTKQLQELKNAGQAILFRDINDQQYYLEYSDSCLTYDKDNNLLLKTKNLYPSHLVQLGSNKWVGSFSDKTTQEKSFLLLDNNTIQAHKNINQSDTQQFPSVEEVSSSFSRIKTDHNGQNWLYVRTSNKVYKLDDSLNIKQQITQLPKALIVTVIFDQQNNMWIASREGIHKLNFFSSPFKTIQPLSFPFNEFSNRQIIKSTTNKYILLTYDGIFTFNKKENRLRKISSFHISLNICKDDSTDNIYVSAHNEKIYQIAPYGIKKEFDLLDPNGQQLIFAISENAKTLIFSDNAQNIIASKENKLFKLDKQQDRFYQFLDIEILSGEDNINNLFDFGQQYGLATTEGIVFVDKQTQTFELFLEGISVQYIHQDKKDKDIFWIGTTNDGMIRWNKANDKTEAFNIQTGLSNNNIHCIFESDNEQLWLSSDFGIMQFDKNTKATSLYSKEDGFPDNEFNKWAYFKEGDGTIFFGGIKGIVYFNPKDFKNLSPNQQEGIQIQRAWSVFENGKTHTDHKTQITRSQSLNIPDNAEETLIDFFVPDYINTARQRYRYRLLSEEEDASKDWIYLNSNHLSFYRKAYKSYQLEVEFQNSFGRWSNRIQPLTVTFQKPYYLQTWFYLTSALTMILLGFLIAQYRVRMIRTRNLQLEREIQERTLEIAAQKEQLEKLNHTKDTFFTIIAHDLKSPIIALRNFPAKIKYLIDKNQLSRIDELSHHFEKRMALLNSLLDNLFAWALDQRGEIPYKPQQIDIRQCLQQNLDLFESMAIIKQIQFELRFDENATAYADQNAVDSILRNLISNALKFSYPEKVIVVEAREAEKGLVIKVIDQGVGMSADMIKSLFSESRILNGQKGTRGEHGNGLGLLISYKLAQQNHGKLSVKSKIGQGSTFLLQLPSGW